MASDTLQYLMKRVAFYCFAIFNFFLFLFLFLKNGAFFRQPSEQHGLQYAIGQYSMENVPTAVLIYWCIEKDRFWNLHKSPFPGFNHYFYTLRNDLKLHYISNRNGPFSGHLVVMFHGFPDSSMMWRHLFQEKAIPLQDATFVAVDLPGYGGSDSFSSYDTEVLEALTEFVVAMRDKYIPAEESETTNTFIVGHDWGCVLGFRLAAEAPSLADRFILTNAPHVSVTSLTST